MRLGDVLRARVKDVEVKEAAPVSEEGEMIHRIPLVEIEASPFQPRTAFSSEDTEALAQSLSRHGLIQPVVVRPCPGGYQLVAGERRVIAARRLGWETIPAIVKELDDATSAQMALIENLQRRDLDYWEEALAYQRLLQEFGMTQEALARSVGRSQSAIANKLRLLQLSPAVRACISREIMTERHCRTLLSLDSEDLQLQAVAEIGRKQLSVRQTEMLVQRLLRGKADGADSVAEGGQNAHLLQIGIRRLVEEVKARGTQVELEERETPEALEFQVRVLRTDGRS